MTGTTIITHPGQAHQDDFLSCCYLLARIADAGKIYRREPTQSELNDPNIYVVDVGKQHDPKLLNFDHHQFARDHVPTCALTLVLDHFGDLSDWREIFPWLSYLETLDSKGPFFVADKLGIDPDDLIGICSSPIAGYILQGFSTWIGDDTIYMMKDLGYHLIKKVENVRKAWKTLDQTAIVEHVMVDIDEILTVVDATVLGTDHTGLETWCRRQKEEISATITMDPWDSGGFQLYRRNDCPLLDFSKISHLVPFAHENGFIAKTNPKADWRSLMKTAIVN